LNDYIKIVLQADPSGMISGFNQAEGAIAKLVSATQSAGRALQAGGQMWDNFAKSVQNAGRKTMAQGIAMGVSLGASVKKASDFQVQMTNVQSLTKVSDYNLKSQSDSIMAMSERLPQTATNLATGLYDIASSGYSGADGLMILEAAATSASAGLTTTEVASNAIVTALNAYGLEAKDAADISDTLFQGVNVGVMTFEQLAGSMGDWVGMAAQVGVTAQEGTAAIAAMTLAGISAGEAGTYLSRMMQEFLQPSEKMTAKVKDMGYSSAKALLDAKGLGGAILELNKATGGNAEEFSNLFGSIQALRGALAITSNEGANYARVAGAITDKTKRAGAAQDVYAVQAKTLSVQTQLFTNALGNFAIQVGTPLLAPLATLMGWLAKFLNFIADLGKNTQGIMSSLGAFGSVFLTITGGIAAFFPQLVAARIALMGFRGALALSSGASAGAGIAGLLANLGGRFPRITAMVVAFGNALKAALSIDVLQKGFTAVKVGLAAVATGISQYVTGNMTAGALAGKAGSKLIGGTKGMFSAAGSVAMTALTSSIGLATIALAASVAMAANLVNTLNQARDAGREAGETLKSSLTDDSFGQTRSSISKINSELKESDKRLAELGMAPGPMGKKGDGLWESGYGISGGESVKYAFLDWLPFSNFGDKGKKTIEEREFQREIIEERERLEGRQKEIESLAALAGAQASGAKSYVNATMDFIDRPGFELSAEIASGDRVPLAQMLLDPSESAAKIWIRDNIDPIAKSIGTSREGLLFQFDRAMQTVGVSVDDLLNPDTAQGAFNQVSNMLGRLSGKSVSQQGAINAFEQIKQAAGDATSQIEKLNNALKFAVQQSLGPEMAKDQLEGMVNSTLEAVNKIKENGNLSEAMDFGNFSEDALSLRGQWQQIVQGLVEETTAWASSQESVTGVQIAQHLQGQIDKIRAYGAEMGLSTEFVERYVTALQQAITNGDVVTSFVTNVDEAQGQVRAYLTTIGRTPEQIETIVNLLNADVSIDELRKWLGLTGMSPEQIDTVIRVNTEEAAGKVQTYLNSLGQIDQRAVVENIVRLVGEVDPTAQEIIRGDLKNLGLTDEQIDMIVDLSGDGLTQSQTLQKVLENIGVLNPQPTVNVTDNATGVLNGIIGQLNNIRGGATANVNVTTTGAPPTPSKSMWSGSAPTPSSGPKYPGKGGPANTGTGSAGPKYPGKNADGNIRGMIEESPGSASIYAPATQYRIFAEPETGGEAYIPLAQSKRKRSQKIWWETGRRIGTVAFADGGMAYGSGGMTYMQEGGLLEGRLNSDDGKKAKDQEEQNWKNLGKAGEDQKKAAADQKEAAETQQQAAEDTRRSERNTLEYKFDVEGSIGPIEYIWKLLGQMSNLPQYSDEWIEIGRKVNDLNKELRETAYAAQDAFYEIGAITDEQQLGNLERRLTEQRVFTREWWELGVEIFNFKKKIEENRRDLEDALYDTGNMSFDNRIAQLKRRLSTEKAWSSEWLKIQNDIANEEMGLAKAKLEFGEMGYDQYIAFMNSRLAKAEKFSSNWSQITKEINETESKGITKIADVYSKFGSQQAVSSTSVIKWLERQVTMGKKWAETIAQLKASGAYNPAVIEQLVEAGPASAGLANALMKAIGAGQAGSINDLLNQAKRLGINTTSYDSGGYLPPGYTLAYNGTGKNEPVGSGGVVVNLPNATISSPNDAKRFGDRVAFAINSVGL